MPWPQNHIANGHQGKCLGHRITLPNCHYTEIYTMKFLTFARWPGIYVGLIHHGKSISWFSRHNILWWKRAIIFASQGLRFGSPFSPPLADLEYILRIRALTFHWLRLPVHVSNQKTFYTEHMLSTKCKQRCHFPFWFQWKHLFHLPKLWNFSLGWQ